MTCGHLLVLAMSVWPSIVLTLPFGGRYATIVAVCVVGACGCLLLCVGVDGSPVVPHPAEAGCMPYTRLNVFATVIQYHHRHSLRQQISDRQLDIETF